MPRWPLPHASFHQGLPLQRPGRKDTWAICGQSGEKGQRPLQVELCSPASSSTKVSSSMAARGTWATDVCRRIDSALGGVCLPFAYSRLRTYQPAGCAASLAVKQCLFLEKCFANGKLSSHSRKCTSLEICTCLYALSTRISLHNKLHRKYVMPSPSIYPLKLAH